MKFPRFLFGLARYCDPPGAEGGEPAGLAGVTTGVKVVDAPVFGVELLGRFGVTGFDGADRS
jgi:hypothetical protein